jgi:hypothetical protein
MAKKEIKDKEQFFVGISGTAELRRNILEGSREMVHTLQSFEKLQDIRKEKLRRIKQFKTVLEELKLLISKLNDATPQIRLKQPVSNKKLKSEMKKSKSKKSKQTKEKDILELKKLEEDLSSIEGRLSQLR